MTVTRHATYIILLITIMSAMALGAPGDKVLVLNWDKLPETYPLRLVQNDNAEVGELMDYEVRPLAFTLKNISDKEVHIVTIMAGCPCIIFTEKLKDITLKPQEEYAFKTAIHGRHLKAGPFTRIMYVETEGHQLAQIACRGTVVPKVSFSPSQTIDLGSITTADLNWKRTFVIKSLLPQGQLKLLPPKEDDLISLKLTQLNPQEFQVDISPRKLPLPAGTHVKTFELPVQGVKGYGPLPIVARIIVKRPAFHLSQSRLRIRTSELDVTQEHRITTDIRYGQPPRRRRGFRNRSQRPNPRVTEQPASVEEQKARPLNSKQTWEGFAKGMTVQFPKNYPGLTYTFIPEQDHMKLQIAFPPNYFTQKPHGRLHLPVIYKGNRFAEFRFSW